jgi:hypothetical protein
VDGWLDDWTGKGAEVAALAFGEESWTGPADLGAAGFVAWDAVALYVAARVHDDQFSQPSTGAELHLGDGVELQLDTALEADWDSATYSADDWQIGLSPGDFGAVGPEAFVWRPVGVPADGIQVAAQRTADGYILEAALPWELLGMDPSATDRLGFALNVSDNDTPEPAQLALLSSAPSRSWSDPRTFGTLLLER